MMNRKYNLGRQALLFLKKSLVGREAKKLSLLAALVWLVPGHAISKSFLLLFFKKEALSYLYRAFERAEV